MVGTFRKITLRYDGIGKYRYWPTIEYPYRYRPKFWYRCIPINNQNDWATVTSVAKFKSTNKVLKIQFERASMVQLATEKGIIVWFQKIPLRKTERDIFIKINVCNNCYSLNHDTKNCTEGKITWCTIYGSHTHKMNNCSSEMERCLNCGEPIGHFHLNVCIGGHMQYLREEIPKRE